jgi:uracil-DNA glycosylase
MQDSIKDHLRFAAELGVAGVSRDPVWRQRSEAQATTGLKVSTAASVAVPVLENQLLSPRLDSGQAPRLDSGQAPRLDSGQALRLDSGQALLALQEEIGDCTRCKLHALGRRQVVFGVGNPSADLMFVGEAPGADEDVQGVPFVGRAGQLLTKIIEAISLRREDVYIANVIKCRPPQNRNPEPDEIDTCEPFLFRQIDLIKPKVIVALGKFGAQTLLRTEEPISRLRGRVFDFRGAKLIPTFHPAYLLRNPASKREVWEDMKLVKRLLG